MPTNFPASTSVAYLAVGPMATLAVGAVLAPIVLLARAFLQPRPVACKGRGVLGAQPGGSQVANP